MHPVSSDPVVHLELRTDDLPRACAFFTRVLGWRAETIHVGSLSYLALDLGGRVDGGVVECDVDRPVWLPYLEVADVYVATRKATLLGASVSLSPREGPAGWRSVIEAPAGAQIGLWQPKSRPPSWRRSPTEPQPRPPRSPGSI